MAPFGNPTGAFQNKTIAWPYKHSRFEIDKQPVLGDTDVTFLGDPVMWLGSLEVTWQGVG
jgi:hypothetical protein